MTKASPHCGCRKHKDRLVKGMEFSLRDQIDTTRQQNTLQKARSSEISTVVLFTDEFKHPKGETTGRWGIGQQEKTTDHYVTRVSHTHQAKYPDGWSNVIMTPDPRLCHHSEFLRSSCVLGNNQFCLNFYLSPGGRQHTYRMYIIED